MLCTTTQFPTGLQFPDGLRCPAGPGSKPEIFSKLLRVFSAISSDPLLESFLAFKSLCTAGHRCSYHIESRWSYFQLPIYHSSWKSWGDLSSTAKPLNYYNRKELLDKYPNFSSLRAPLRLFCGHGPSNMLKIYLALYWTRDSTRMSSRCPDHGRRTAAEDRCQRTVKGWRTDNRGRATDDARGWRTEAGGQVEEGRKTEDKGWTRKGRTRERMKGRRKDERQRTDGGLKEDRGRRAENEKKGQRMEDKWRIENRQDKGSRTENGNRRLKDRNKRRL